MHWQIFKNINLLEVGTNNKNSEVIGKYLEAVKQLGRMPKKSGLMMGLKIVFSMLFLHSSDQVLMAKRLELGVFLLGSPQPIKK